MNSCVFGQTHETWLMQLKKGPTSVITSANVKQRKTQCTKISKSRMEKKLHTVYEWKKATKVMNDSKKEKKRVFIISY